MGVEITASTMENGFPNSPPTVLQIYLILEVFENKSKISKIFTIFVENTDILYNLTYMSSSFCVKGV